MLKFNLWCFKITLCFVLMLCFVMAQSKENSEEEKKSVKRKPGYVRMKPEKSKGRQVMEINIDGKTENVEMVKKKLPVMSKPPSEKNEDVSIYLSQDGTTACMKECKHNKTECKAQCLKQTEYSYTYVSGNNVMDIKSNGTLAMDFNFTSIYEQRREALIRNANTTHRKKREAETPPLIVPNINEHTAILKVKLLISHEVMKLFQDIFDANATQAKAEAAYFFTLAMNTVEMLWSTISDWGYSFTTLDGVNKTLDMGVYLQDIDFPQVVDNTFIPIEHIQNSAEDGFLTSKIYLDGDFYYLGETGLLIDTAYYMWRTYGGTTSFNHLQVITGYGIAFEYYRRVQGQPDLLIARFDRVAGFVPDIGVTCVNFAELGFDLRFSFSTVYAPQFTGVMAHEIGHIMGAYHDQDEHCGGEEIYVMNPTNFPKYPQFSDSYYKFSSCSAGDIANYLSSFTYGELTSCLYTSSPTEKEFLSKFCKGFLGSRYGVNFHCEFFVDKSSSICPSGDYTFENGYLPADGCEIKEVNNQFYPVFLCADKTGCENTRSYIAHVFEGTKCLNEDGTQGDKVCYRGKCRSELEICDDYEGDDEEEESESESEESEEQSSS